jgi:hypothetical protein
MAKVMIPSPPGAMARFSNLPVFRSGGSRFYSVDVRVVAEVRGEVELAVVFDEGDVALALDDCLLISLADGVVEAGDMGDCFGLRVEGVHLRGDVVLGGGEHVVDGAIVGDGDAVPGFATLCFVGEVRVVGGGL